MKAEIDENGKLSVIPETRVEQFALSQWWKDYSRLDGGDRFAELEICRIEVNPLVDSRG